VTGRKVVAEGLFCRLGSAGIQCLRVAAALGRQAASDIDGLAYSGAYLSCIGSFAVALNSLDLRFGLLTKFGQPIAR
jgi:hypothetical protein